MLLFCDEGEPPHEVVTDPATQQTMVTGLTWVPLVTVSDMDAVVAACQRASNSHTSGEGTTVLTLHCTSGPPAALAERLESATGGQTGPARLLSSGQPRRVPAPSAGAVSTCKLSFVDVAAASAEEATASTAGRRGLSNLRSRMLGDGTAQQGVQPCNSHLTCLL